MKRRSLLQSPALAALGSLPAYSRAAATRSPNVIVIMTDDQGYGDLSLHGNPVLLTPNMDRLGSTGLRFDDFHTAPTGTATRAQLLTGQDSLRTRASTDSAGRSLLRRDLPTMAELFRREGYTTGIFGKWALGHAYPDRPQDRGFDRCVWFKGSNLQNALELDNDYVNPRYLDQDVERRADAYCTDHWFSSAIDWMEQQQRRGQPFLTLLTPNTPHLPLWLPDAYRDLYRDRVDDSTAAFYAMIANLDDNVGRLEQWLQDSGAWSNSIVVLLGDNGGTLGSNLYNAGLRDFKGSHYEGGHRAFCFLRWPEGGFDAGRVVDTPTQVQDLLPTLLDLCALPAGRHQFDGRSLAPLTIGGAIPDRRFVVQDGLRSGPEKHHAAVVWQQWRLQNGRELYDIDADRAQQRDLARRHPDIVQELRAFYDTWWQALEPTLAVPVPRFIGAGREASDLLSCNDWWNVDVPGRAFVIDAAGDPRGGIWHVDVITAGDYAVELRRWPFHTNLAIGAEAPQSTISGRALIQRGRRIAAGEAVFSVDGVEQRAFTTPEAPGVQFRVQLSRGAARLQGWFCDAGGKELCGAYYLQLRRPS